MSLPPLPCSIGTCKLGGEDLRPHFNVCLIKDLGIALQDVWRNISV